MCIYVYMLYVLYILYILYVYFVYVLYIRVYILYMYSYVLYAQRGLVRVYEYGIGFCIYMFLTYVLVLDFLASL